MLGQAIGRATIRQRYRVVYREAHTLIEETAEATLSGTRQEYLADLASAPLLIIDGLGMRKLPHTAAEDLFEHLLGDGRGRHEAGDHSKCAAWRMRRKRGSPR